MDVFANFLLLYLSDLVHLNGEITTSLLTRLCTLRPLDSVS